MRRESALESWAVSWARFRGIIVAKLKDLDGIPDRIFFVPGGAPIIVEFKAEGKVGGGLQEETQPWYLAKLKEYGYKVCYCETKDEFRQLMKRYDKCRTKKSKTCSTS